MSAPPPHLSLREEQAIDRWVDEQQNGSMTGGHSSGTCICGAWLRSDITGTSRCARSEAVVNRHGDPVGGPCEGFPDHRDKARTLLRATVCGIEDIIVGVACVRRKPNIMRCQLCEWEGRDKTDTMLLHEHLVDIHNLDDCDIVYDRVLFVEADI